MHKVQRYNLLFKHTHWFTSLQSLLSSGPACYLQYALFSLAETDNSQNLQLHSFQGGHTAAEGSRSNKSRHRMASILDSSGLGPGLVQSSFMASRNRLMWAWCVTLGLLISTLIWWVKDQLISRRLRLFIWCLCHILVSNKCRSVLHVFTSYPADMWKQTSSLVITSLLAQPITIYLALQQPAFPFSRLVQIHHKEWNFNRDHVRQQEVMWGCDSL